MHLHPLTSPLLSKFHGFHHGFFTRAGGVSEGLYASLNCGPGSADHVEDVLENRKRVVRHLKAEGICSLYQVHGTEVVTVTNHWQQLNAPKADAMVTALPGVAIGILTADCAPVLLLDSQAKVAGAAHAGWKSAFGGILANTVDAMEALGAERGRIHAAIGPCIAQESYQVDSAFHAKFMDESADYGPFFDRDISSSSHYLFNLKGFVESRLRQAGVAEIHALPDNTYVEESQFFSYRRATHRGEPDYGRQISAIMIKGD